MVVAPPLKPPQPLRPNRLLQTFHLPIPRYPPARHCPRILPPLLKRPPRFPPIRLHPTWQPPRRLKSTRVAEQVALDIQAQLAEYGFPTDVGHLGWVQQEPEAISLDTFGEYLYTEFAEDLVASDFILRTDITWKTDGLVMCGLMFRSEPNFETGAQYSFLYMRLSGLPAWAIEYYKDGYFVSEVSTLKFSSAIKMENGATNNLILAAEGNKFTLIINDEKLGSFYDWSSKRIDGKFAFQGLQEAGPSTCTFENSWVWMLK